MSLLNPIGLAWAAVAVPIIALYVLKIRRRRQVVPTLMFWDQIFQDTAPRSLWRRLRHWLSLLMQLAFLMLLVLALADPVWSGASRRRTHWVLVLDQSASMQAGDGASSRFDQAKQAAHRTIRSMRAQDQATVIAAGVQPTIACGRTHHQPALHQAVDALAALDAPCDLHAAVRLAESIDVGDQRRAIVVVTDPPGASGLDDEPGGAMAVTLCGGDAANVGITGFAVRPRSDNPLELQGMLRVANFSDHPASVDVRLTRDGQLFDVISMSLAAGEETLRTFRHVHTGGRVLRAELSKPDALMVDNTAAAVLPETKDIRVALVCEGNLFLESVLAVHPWLKVRRWRPVDLAEAVKEADILVFDEHVPQTLPDKPSLFIHPKAASPLWSLGGDLKRPLVSDVADGAELLRHVNLTNCTLRGARAVRAKTEAKTLASSFENPLLLSWSGEGPPRVVLAVDVKQGDLPLRTAFPILMQNTLNHLAGQTDEPVSAYATGRAATVAIHAADAVASDDRGRSVPITVHDDRSVVGPVTAAGLVTVRAGAESVDLAFNLADSAESNLRRHPTSRPAADADDMLASSGWSWPWWVMLAMAAIGLSTAEWCLHQRRRID